MTAAAGAAAWRIADWDKFENSRSRGVRYCQFVAVPIVLDDVRYARLMRQPDGPACFGVYLALVQWHMSRFGGDVRSGWLTDDGGEWGEPLTVDDLAAYLKMDDVTVSVALDTLSAPSVGWLQNRCGVGAELVRSCGRDLALAHAGGTGDYGQRTEKEGDVVGVSCGRARGGPTTPASAGRRQEEGDRSRETGRPATPPPACAGDRGMQEEGDRSRETERPATPPPAEAGDGGSGAEAEEEETGRGERSALPETGTGEGYETGQRQPPPARERLWDPEAAAMVEIPCRDGAYSVPLETLKRYARAYPDVNVTAQLLRMQDWAFSKIEAGGAEAEKAWGCDVAPAGVTGWLAEEQKKAENPHPEGAAGRVGRRSAGGCGGAGWKGEIEALDKQKRAVNAQINALCDKYRFNDGHEYRERRPVAWAKVKALRGEVEAINARIANVRREG